MCVICYKPAGKPMPSDETIKKMFEHNPHGAGYALQGYIGKNGRFSVEYHKGFMTLESFMKAIKSHGDLTNINVAMHFRIKTHGETDQQTTHPFRISSQFEDLRKLDGKGHPIVFHNGTFEGFGGMVDPRASDTQDWVIGVATRYLKDPHEPSKLQKHIVSKTTNTCRVLILYPNANFKGLRLGNWEEVDGLFYSNTNWQYSYSNYYSRSYDDYYNKDKEYRTQKQLTSGKTYKSTVFDFDAYGCNNAKYAWPSSQTDWLNAGSKERYETIMKAATKIGEKDGWNIVQFKSTAASGHKYYCMEDTLDIVAENKLEAYAEKMEDWGILMGFNLDFDDEYIEFQDEQEMADFALEGVRVGDYEYKLARKNWLFDTVNLIAMTEKGVKQLYKTGEQGHVIKNLRELGVDNKWAITEGGNPYYHEQGGIIDADEFDEIPLGIGDDDDYYDDEVERLANKVDKAYGLA